MEIVDVETPQHLEHVRQPFSEYFRRLDTADSMTKARGLYASLGLRESAPYYEAPPPIFSQSWSLLRGPSRRRRSILNPIGRMA